MSGTSTYVPKSALARWIEARLPIVGLVHSSFIAYPTPRNLNYFWTFGAILSFMLVVQIVTGVVLYARVPGAFVDLAADAGWLDATRVVRVDEHLPARADSSASTYLLDQSTVDQAIGVLLARGATLDGARVALAERARAGRTTRAEVARRILAELDEGPPLRS